MSFTADAVTCDRNLLWGSNVLVFQSCWINLLWQFLDCSTVYLFEMETKLCCLLLLPAYDYAIHLSFFAINHSQCYFPIVHHITWLLKRFPSENKCKGKTWKKEEVSAFEKGEECLSCSMHLLSHLLTADLKHMLLGHSVSFSILSVTAGDYSVW